MRTFAASSIKLQKNNRDMKKLLGLLTVCTTFLLVSCNRFDLESSVEASAKANAENTFGSIDPNQSWSSINSGTITVTADAPLYDVIKVQILTSSPFANSNATVLAEAEIAKGQSTTLKYDAPNIYDRLIAACVDSKGHYYVKGFDLGDELVFFSDVSAARTRALTRSENDYPAQGTLKFDINNSILSFNALRTIAANNAVVTTDEDYKKWVNDQNLYLWEGSGWEEDRLWTVSNGSTSSSWTINDGGLRRDAAAMTESEKSTLNDMFGDFLQRSGSDSKVTFGRKENREYIRNSDIVKLYNNELTSDGSTPLTITPIWMPSSEIGKCRLYFYYYNPNDIPSGMTEAEYIKTLPKFSAMSCDEALNKAGNGTNYNKGYEYLLPYYGEAEAFKPQLTDFGSFAATDGKLYRIRLGAQRYNENYYMTYNVADELNQQMSTLISDGSSSVANQLWLVYTTSDGYKFLYNVGGKKFLTWSGYWDSPFSDVVSEIKSKYFRFDDDHHIFRYTNKMALGMSWSNASKINKFNISSDKGTGDGEYAKWYFEEYTGNKVTAPSKVTLKEYASSTITAPGTVIPKGYKIGFMLRKVSDGNTSNNKNYVQNVANGCCYSFGKLNQEINNFPGHFGSPNSNSTYNGSMETDDPRAAIFNGNGRTYIAFEDGSDCQYNDMLIEIGGYDTTVLNEAPEGSEEKGNGIENNCLYDLTEIDGIAYTLCFEDRPMEADYDLNDVVLRCKRLRSNLVELSIVAAGAYDNVVIKGISGEFKEGYNLNGREVHEIFYKEDATDNDRYINTLKGVPFDSPKSGVYNIGNEMTIPEFLSKIYIDNETTGMSVAVAKTGDSPCGIIIPGSFDYPMEGENIKAAYQMFTYWVRDASNCKDWYIEDNADLDKVILLTNVLKQNQ